MGFGGGGHQVEVALHLLGKCALVTGFRGAHSWGFKKRCLHRHFEASSMAYADNLLLKHYFPFPPFKVFFWGDADSRIPPSWENMQEPDLFRTSFLTTSPVPSAMPGRPGARQRRETVPPSLPKFTRPTSSVVS